MRMPKLERIINSAGFDYLTFPVGGHCQVIGVNGHGKSTLLRTVLFFYLGTNEKAPYALHETKADFVSHYLGAPPSYLIYEVSRGDDQPGYHIAVTRPAGRIQFHFVDAPFRKEYYVDGKFVQPIESVQVSLRDAKCPVDSVSSYEEFHQRIFGLVSSTYAVFRPAARNSGQVGVLPRIISGIFTVSQLDADKLKSALTCGVKQDALATELDLVQLKGHLENFRRVNRAVKKYLLHEQTALELVDLAEEYERVESQRRRAVEELIRLAKMIPDEKAQLTEQFVNLESEEKSASAQFESEHQLLVESINQLNKDIAVLHSDIEKGQRIQNEYEQRQIAKKSEELDGLQVLVEQQRIAHLEYESLTAKFADEGAVKSRLLEKLQQTINTIKISFQERRSSIERKEHSDLEVLGTEESTARVALESEQTEAQRRFEPRRSQLDAARARINTELRTYAEMKPPAEFSALARKLKEAERNQRDEQTKQECLRNEMIMLKERAKTDQARRERDAKEEIDVIERQVVGLEQSRDQLELEVAAFQASLARFFQTKAPKSWPDAAKTLNRETLFRTAEELGASSVKDDEASLWGVQISTTDIPFPSGSYDPDDLAGRLRKVREDLKRLKDQKQAAHERYLNEHSSAEKIVSQKHSELDAQLGTSIDAKNQAVEAALRFDNDLTSLQSRYEESRLKIRTDLDAREATWKLSDEELRKEQLEVVSQFGVRFEKMVSEMRERKKSIQTETKNRLDDLTAEESTARQRQDAERSRIENDFQSSLSAKGADPSVMKTVSERVSHLANEINRIDSFRNEVIEYRRLKIDSIDRLPGWKSQHAALIETHLSKVNACNHLERQHEAVKTHFTERRKTLEECSNALQADENAVRRFRNDTRFLQEWGFFEREDFSPAAFYRPGSAGEFLAAAESEHQNLEKTGKEGDRGARAFLNRFDAETLDRRVLGFSPIHEEHFNWYLFVGGELKPFVRKHSISAMKRIQTQEFEQLIRNVCNKNADFREGIRQVNQTADLVQNHLRDNNFVDVLDSIELKVERVDTPLTRTLATLEEFADVSFGTDQDLFGKIADRGQIDRAIETFERLLREIDSYKGTELLLTDYFDFLIRVHENGHDMGWRKSLDHIGSTGTDYLVKMLVYLSLIEVYRARAIDPKSNSSVHCVLDETGVLAAKYVRSVLAYAAARGIILVTAGHSQQTTGFEHWILVRKTGHRFAGQTILRKILRCD